MPAFRRLLDEGFFQGFDEIWLLDGGARAARPPELVLTSDHPVERVPAESWRAWLIAGGARLGLGDGVGLNYVTDDASIRGSPRPLGCRVESVASPRRDQGIRSQAGADAQR